MKIELFGLGLRGKSANVTAVERLNLYAELQPFEDKTRLAFFPTPGTLQFIDLGETPVRGVWVPTINDTAYVVHRNTLYSVLNNGTVTALGTLGTTSGPVSMTDNGISILIVDGVGGYFWNIQTSTFTTISSPDFPAGARWCTWLAQRFVIGGIPDSQEFFWGDVLADTFSPLNFAAGEASPDILVRPFADHGQLILAGDTTTEFWSPSNDPALPYTPVQGAVIEWGLAAAQSMCKFSDSVVMLARNRLGQVQIVKIQGYQITPISTPDLDYRISQYAEVGNATAFSYLLGGHPMYQINFSSESWLYDGLTQDWTKVGADNARHFAEIGFNFVNKTRVTNSSNGKVYTLSADYLTDDGSIIPRQMTSRHLFGEDPVPVAELWVDMEGGVGTISGQGENPVAMLRTSDDGGHTWSNEIMARFGPQGVRGMRAVWRRLGRTRDRVFRIRVTDPVKTVFIGAWMR